MASKVIRNTIRQSVVRGDQLLRQEVNDELDRTAEELTRKQRLVVARWKIKPRFRAEKKITGSIVRVLVVPDRRSKAGKIYQWIDKGTGRYGPSKRAYKIPSVVTADSKLLRFRTGYIAKTAPIARVKAGGMAVGGWVSARQVTHPGIKARKFSETFNSQLSPDFRRRIENAIRRAVRRNNGG
jgi:hypothetical protein